MRLVDIQLVLRADRKVVKAVGCRVVLHHVRAAEREPKAGRNRLVPLEPHCIGGLVAVVSGTVRWPYWESNSSLTPGSSTAMVAGKTRLPAIACASAGPGMSSAVSAAAEKAVAASSCFPRRVAVLRMIFILIKPWRKGLLPAQASMK